MNNQNQKALIDSIVDLWHEKFSELQRKQSSGENVSESDVRSVLMEVGEELYKSGVATDTNGYRSDEIQKIIEGVSKHTVRAGVAGQDGNKVELNPIQLAGLKAADEKDRVALIESIHSDPGFVPKLSNTTAPTDGTAQLDTEVRVSIQDHAYTVSRSMLDKIAPPSNFTQASHAGSTAPEPAPVAPITEKLFKIQHDPDDNKPTPGFKLRSGGAALVEEQETQLIQMPVRVIEPSVMPGDDHANFGI